MTNQAVEIANLDILEFFSHYFIAVDFPPVDNSLIRVSWTFPRLIWAVGADDMASGGAEEDNGCTTLDIDNMHMLLQGQSIPVL